jgi:fucose 4-O-acetylase-like acetyltransferase
MAVSLTLKPQGRLEWIDAAKGMGIALVVLGHTMRGLVNAGLMAPGGAGEAVDRWIYAFHMPLFFVLSGLFLTRLADRPLRTYIADRFLRLGYPYLVWVPLQTLIQVALSRFTNHPADLGHLVRTFYDPPMQFWFLYVLLLQCIIFGVLWKAGVGWMGMLVVSILVWGSARWVPAGTWGPLIQARDYLPYLAFGVALGRPRFLNGVGALPAVYAGCIAVAGYTLVCAFLSFGLLGNREAALGAALAGTAATLALATLLARFRGSLVLTAWGRGSLAIYCAHTIASAGVRVALRKIAHVESTGFHLAAGLAAGLYGPLALVWMCERLRFPYLFEFPKRRRPEATTLPSSVPQG